MLPLVPVVVVVVAVGGDWTAGRADPTTPNVGVKFLLMLLLPLLLFLATGGIGVSITAGDGPVLPPDTFLNRPLLILLCGFGISGYRTGECDCDCDCDCDDSTTGDKLRTATLPFLLYSSWIIGGAGRKLDDSKDPRLECAAGSGNSSSSIGESTMVVAVSVDMIVVAESRDCWRSGPVGLLLLLLLFGG